VTADGTAEGGNHGMTCADHDRRSTIAVSRRDTP